MPVAVYFFYNEKQNIYKEYLFHQLQKNLLKKQIKFFFYSSDKILKLKHKSQITFLNFSILLLYPFSTFFRIILFLIMSSKKKKVIFNLPNFLFFFSKYKHLCLNINLSAFRLQILEKKWKKSFFKIVTMHTIFKCQPDCRKGTRTFPY